MIKDQERLTKKLIDNRGRMVMNMPWFAQLAMNLTPHFSEKIDKCYTDGIVLALDPEWVADASDNDIQLVWAEAALKCALKLPFRKGYRDDKLWNDSATFTVGPHLAQEFTLPEGFPTKREDFEDKTTEEIYNILYTEQMEQDSGGGSDSGSGGGSGNEGDNGSGTCDIKSPDDQDAKEERDDYEEQNGDRPEPGGNREISPQELADDWEVNGRTAYKNAKGVGNTPAWLDRMMQTDIEAQIDWRAKLREYVELCLRDDYTMRRFNRRHIANDMYLPSLWSENLPDIALLVDVSGSVRDSEFEFFLAELSGILREFDTTVHMYQFDTQPKGEAIIFTSEDLPLQCNRRGAGGTDPCSTFAKLAEDDIEPVCIIGFSDMEIWNYPEGDKIPEQPMLWVSTQKIKRLKENDYMPPFGEVCELVMDERKWS